MVKTGNQVGTGGQQVGTGGGDPPVQGTYHVQIRQTGDFKKISDDRNVAADDHEAALRQIVQRLQKDEPVGAPQYAAVTLTSPGKHHETVLFFFPLDPRSGRLLPPRRAGTVKFDAGWD